MDGPIATWMQMLLNNGEVNGHQVLDPITFRQMVTPNFRNAPAVHAIAHGFFIRRHGRYASLEHDGETLWFHSNMVVLPQAGIGVFVATNTNTGALLAQELPRLIFERFLPGALPSPPPPPPSGFARSGQAYAGTYLAERRDFSTIEKVLRTPVAAVKITPHGHLLVNGGDSGRYVDSTATTVGGPLSHHFVNTRNDSEQWLLRCRPAVPSAGLSIAGASCKGPQRCPR